MKLKPLFLLIFLSQFLITSCKTETKQPNIIFILADDLGYSDLGCYGQEKIETPNIDALAENGMLFSQHYCGAPVCAPSRCVLLTGKHGGHAEIRSNDEWSERGDVWDYAKAVEDPNLEGQRPMKAGTETIGSILQKAGYKTGIVGKWGLGAPLSEAIPNKLGFDFFFGYNCQRQAHTYYPRHLWKDTTKVWLKNELVSPQSKPPEGFDPYNEASYSDYTLNEYSPELMQKEVINFIRQNNSKVSGQPFFMYYATPIPHAALQAPKRWVDYYYKKFGEEEPYIADKGYFPVRYPHATYAAMVSYLDEQVGELIQELKDLGIYENTMILFSSDNGPTYNGGTDSPWFNSAKPFKSEQGWGKGYVHEGGIRVPMIVSFPGKIMAGSKSEHISAFYDIMPTLCDIAGIESPQETDGVSYFPELIGSNNQKEHEYLYWEFPSYGGQQAVRMGKWKGIRMDILKDSMQVCLYNLEEDIHELDDVSNENPEIVKKIEEIFVKEHTPAENERFRIKQLGD